jgi:two-component system, LuxR family, sensor kinase FixL
MHPILNRQLKRCGLSESAPPTGEEWSRFLDAVGRAYADADKDRYLVERSLELSSREMRELHGQLAAERDAVRTVVRSLVEGVCALDSEGTVILINPAARRLLRLDRPDPELLGHRLADVADLTDESGQRVDVGAGRGAGERRVIVGGDRASHIVLTVRPMDAGSGSLLTLRDVSEEKRLEAEREKLHKQLVEVSRHVGMAEVASGVLHNVGNVLNSVTVSASMARERLDASKLPGLAKAVSLLREHEGDLVSYLTCDAAGRKLPLYLGTLSDRLAAEHDEIGVELQTLAKNIEHIKEIVNMQQAYGRVSGLREAESIASLIEDAVRINAAGLERHRVRIDRCVAELPQVRVDRHQVVQILVNLISNAKQAVSRRPEGERLLQIRAGATPDGFARVEVEDNGVGIPAEHLTRIFSHGFTTRKDGHGFGLHSAALAARAIGGHLTVRSDGPDRGAVFILDIPLEPVGEGVSR